jgi:DNA-binding NtrC family response regulator
VKANPDKTNLMNMRCLLVEDDTAFAEMMIPIISEQGFDVTHASNRKDAEANWKNQSWDLVLLDNHLPDGKGRDIFHAIKRSHPSQLCVMMTGMPELAHAVEMTRRGLFDYLTKPVAEEAVMECLQRARMRLEKAAPAESETSFVFHSPEMQTVNQAIMQAAQHSDATVLITGETGVGKDVAARWLHQKSHGDSMDGFVSLNCAAIPAEMFESELFGSEKGAFTGADRKRNGLVAAAQDGTLFLDEIGEVPLPLQGKLLHLLESREYRMLGSTKVHQFNGRLIAATNRDLKTEVVENRFREDLYYRIDVFNITIPPLRERRSEIVHLSETFLLQLSKRYQRAVPLIRPDDHNALTQYEFPGNVRELRNLIERSLLKTPMDQHWLELDLAWLKEKPPTKSIEQTPARETLEAPASMSELERQEFITIRDALRQENGGIRRAASRLGITHQKLLRRLQKWPELRQVNTTPDA